MSNVLLMSGKVLIDRLTDAGASTGYLDPAEVGTLQIEEKTEIKEITSKGRDTYGQVIATVSLKEPAKVKLTLKEVDPNALAVALLGTTAALTQSAATISSTPDTFTLIPGRWVQMGNQNITPHVDVTSPIVVQTDVESPATPVAIDLDDLEFNYRLGLVKYTGTTLTAPTAVTATYKCGAAAGTRISGSVKPSVRMKILLDGKNLVNGEDIRVLIDEATLTPASPIDFASDDWAEIELEGSLTTLAGKTSPYTVDVIPAA